MDVLVENDMLELKSELVPDICKEVVAFANTHGGLLLIGVASDGTAVGVTDPDNVMLRMNNMIRDSIKPDVTMFIHYEIRDMDGKRIIAVEIQKGTQRPYYIASKGLKPGGVYIRSGSAADPATDTAIRRMIRETDGDHFEEMRSLEQELSFSDAAKEFRKRGITFGPTQRKTLGLVSADGVFSNLGLLLSDQCPGTIKAATFTGLDKDEFQDRREFIGSLFTQMEDLYAYLDLRNQTKATIKGLYRTDTRDYPEEALREAMLNCIVHRDYGYSANTLVSVFTDRIEFVSIGGLPEGVEVEDIMLGLSVCRNPKLAALFYRMHLIEAYGTGIPKIFRAYQGYERQPKIEVTNNAFKITLPSCNMVSGHDVQGTAMHPSEGITKQKYAEETQAIMMYLQEHDSITRGEVETLLGVSQATSNRILKYLIKVGTLRAAGNGKNTRYSRTA